MKLKGSNTTCSGIEWNSLLGLLHQLKKSKRSREYLLIGTGAYLGLHASDLVNLSWSDVWNKDAVSDRSGGHSKYLL